MTETKTANKALILALACAAQFMVVLDVAIVNVALPEIQLDLGLGQSTLQWVVIAYGLLLGGFLLLGGRLGDLLGRRRILLLGLVLFSGASLLAGIADSAALLIGARAFQGFGAALVAPSALSILAVNFSEGTERNWALGIFGAVAGSSASIGVIASGLLTDGPGWRWIFFINIPIGAALIALAARYLPSDSPTAVTRRFDALGAATVTGGLLAFVYGLNRGAEDGWTDAGTLGFFGAALALLAAFALVESRSGSPLVPFSALRNRTMLAADATALLSFAAFFGYIFLGSLFMQQVLLYSPTRTGVAWLATSVTAFVAAGVTGAKLATRFGVKPLLVLGMSLLAIGVLWLTRVPLDANYASDMLPGFVLAGLAVGFVAPAVQIGALTGVTGPAVGLASGLIETMREIGGAIGVAAVSTVLVSRTSDALQSGTAPETAALEGFQAGFGVILVIAVLGALVSSFAFKKSEAEALETLSEPEPEPEPALAG